MYLVCLFLLSGSSLRGVFFVNKAVGEGKVEKLKLV